jgi:serine/threonine protein kinase
VLYAVKRMALEKGSRKTVSQRECEVAQRLCSLTHPCVVRLLAVICHTGYDPLVISLVMEFCAGSDLAHNISMARLHSGSSGYKPPERWRQWLAQIVLGLEHLHFTARMIVRDVKPDNVILDEGCHCAKLTDFGMSKTQVTSDGTFSFAPGMPPGTPQYVAPEVLKGQAYDRRADYYSLGVLTWVLVTGGLKSKTQYPQPPCGEDIPAMTTNWLRVKACVDDPSRNDAHPVDDDNVRNFILTLIDRAPAAAKVETPFLRNHALFEGLAIPGFGADAAEVERWLGAGRDGGRRGWWS